MKIAILVPLFPPKWLAGTEIATYNIAKHLAKRGHEVHVITSLDKGLPKEGIEQGFHIHRIGYPRVQSLGFIVFHLKFLFLIKRIKPDILHSQSVAIGWHAFIAKKVLHKPYLVWVRGYSEYLSWRFRKLISKPALKNADAVIALTEDMKREIQKFCDRGALVIPNGIDLERFEGLPRGNIRRQLKITNGQKIIIFVGTLYSIKGVKYLIQAMKLIKNGNRNARLMLVGNGKERQSLEELTKELDLEEDVTFVGKVPNEEVPQYMIASDVFVLPSLSEGFPNVILEAMACGLPIVVTKVRGLPEIIEEGKNGFLVEPRSPEQIAEKVLQLLEDDDLRERISRNNKEKVKQYSWERIMRRLEDVYRNLVKQED